MQSTRCGQKAGDPLAPPQQEPPFPGRGRERHPENVVDAHWDASRPGRHHPEEAAFGSMGMDDLRPEAPQQPPELNHRDQVAQGRDPAGHLDRVDWDLFVRGEFVEQLAG